MSNDPDHEPNQAHNLIPDANAPMKMSSLVARGPQTPTVQVLRAAEAASAYTPMASSIPQLANIGLNLQLTNTDNIVLNTQLVNAGNVCLNNLLSDTGNPVLNAQFSNDMGFSTQLGNFGNIGLTAINDLQSFSSEPVAGNLTPLPIPTVLNGAAVVPQDTVSATIVNNSNIDADNSDKLISFQRLQHAASAMSSSSIQHASLSVASNLVIQSGGSSSVPGSSDESGTKPNAQGLLACRLPQPPDGRWLGCGQAAHAPIPCYAWQQMGLTHSNQIHDRVFTFTSSQLAASSIPMNRMCAMRQPPFPDQTGPLKQGCGQLAHPDSVCATWIAAGVLTLPEVRQRLLEWKKRFPGAGIAKNEYGPKIIRKLPDKDRCVIPQPPDGINRGCPAGVQHRGTVCESWKAQNVSNFEEIRPALLAWHQEHPNPAVELCDFIQPPDGTLRGCGAPSHKGRICAAWAEMDVLTRQEAIKKVRAFRSQNKPRKATAFRPDAEKLCNLPQPPDGRVIGCGEPFHRMAVCNSWLAFGVPTRDEVKAYVDKYRENTGTTANFARVCRAFQPPDGRVKGCGLGWHRGVCPSWQTLDITDRKSMMEYIQSNIENIAAHSSGTGAPKRRVSYSGISRVTEFPDHANDPDMSLRYLLEGDFDRSVQELTKRILKYPDRASLYNNRGIAYAERGWPDLAIRDCFKAIELDPTYSDAFANRGVARVSLDKPLLAGDDCKKALSFPGGHSVNLVRLTYAMALYESGDCPKCISECESVLNDDPNLVQAKILMGLANGALQRYDVALHYFESASKSGFDKDRVLALLQLAKRKLNESGSAPVSETTSVVQQAETEGSSIIHEEHDDEDILAFSESDFNENYMDEDGDDHDRQEEPEHEDERDQGDEHDNGDILVTDSEEQDDDTISDESMEEI